jgi:hypothetical protein
VLLGNMTPTRRQLVEAALLYAGPDSVITGLESCRQHGLKSIPPDPPVHLLVPHEHKARCTDYVIVERTTRMPDPTFKDRVPLAPLARSVLDACRRFRNHDPIRALLADTVQRFRLAPHRLVYELESGSQPGTAAPRKVLKDIVGGARSVAEVDAMRVW